MIDPNKLPRQVRNNILQALGCEDLANPEPRFLTAISRMSEQEAMDKFCQWEGLLGGWGGKMIGAVDGIRAAGQR